ncbi:unnamed protein product, partial [Closterium sp. NIES-53]
ITINNTNSSLLLVGIRVLVGISPSSHTPSSLSLFHRSLPLDRSSRRWYDLPFTPAESLLADRHVSIHVGPAFGGNARARVDGLEVYGRGKEEFGWGKVKGKVLGWWREWKRVVEEEGRRAREREREVEGREREGKEGERREGEGVERGRGNGEERGDGGEGLSVEEEREERVVGDALAVLTGLVSGVTVEGRQQGEQHAEQERQAEQQAEDGQKGDKEAQVEGQEGKVDLGKVQLLGEDLLKELLQEVLRGGPEEEEEKEEEGVGSPVRGGGAAELLPCLCRSLHPSQSDFVKACDSTELSLALKTQPNHRACALQRHMDALAHIALLRPSSLRHFLSATPTTGASSAAPLEDLHNRLLSVLQGPDESAADGTAERGDDKGAGSKGMGGKDTGGKGVGETDADGKGVGGKGKDGGDGKGMERTDASCNEGADRVSEGVKQALVASYVRLLVGVAGSLLLPAEPTGAAASAAAPAAPPTAASSTADAASPASVPAAESGVTMQWVVTRLQGLLLSSDPAVAEACWMALCALFLPPPPLPSPPPLASPQPSMQHGTAATNVVDTSSNQGAAAGAAAAAAAAGGGEAPQSFTSDSANVSGVNTGFGADGAALGATAGTAGFGSYVESGVVEGGGSAEDMDIDQSDMTHGFGHEFDQNIDPQLSVVQFCCDSCGVCPIQDVRWHCLVCDDFDLCNECHQAVSAAASAGSPAAVTAAAAVAGAAADAGSAASLFPFSSHSISHPMVSIPIDPAADGMGEEGGVEGLMDRLGYGFGGESGENGNAAEDGTAGAEYGTGLDPGGSIGGSGIGEPGVEAHSEMEQQEQQGAYGTDGTDKRESTGNVVKDGEEEEEEEEKTKQEKARWEEVRMRMNHVGWEVLQQLLSSFSPGWSLPPQPTLTPPSSDRSPPMPLLQLLLRVTGAGAAGVGPMGVAMPSVGSIEKERKEKNGGARKRKEKETGDLESPGARLLTWTLTWLVDELEHGWRQLSGAREGRVDAGAGGVSADMAALTCLLEFLVLLFRTLQCRLQPQQRQQQEREQQQQHGSKFVLHLLLSRSSCSAASRLLALLHSIVSSCHPHAPLADTSSSTETNPSGVGGKGREELLQWALCLAAEVAPVCLTEKGVPIEEEFVSEKGLEWAWQPLLCAYLQRGALEGALAQPKEQERTKEGAVIAQVDLGRFGAVESGGNGGAGGGDGGKPREEGGGGAGGMGGREGKYVRQLLLLSCGGNERECVRMQRVCKLAAYMHGLRSCLHPYLPLPASSPHLPFPSSQHLPTPSSSPHLPSPIPPPPPYSIKVQSLLLLNATVHVAQSQPSTWRWYCAGKDTSALQLLAAVAAATSSPRWAAEDEPLAACALQLVALAFDCDSSGSNGSSSSNASRGEGRGSRRRRKREGFGAVDMGAQAAALFGLLSESQQQLEQAARQEGQGQEEARKESSSSDGAASESSSIVQFISSFVLSAASARLRSQGCMVMQVCVPALLCSPLLCCALLCSAAHADDATVRFATV